MPVVVRIIGGVPGIERYPELAEQIGRYLVDYEPERAPKGEQWLWTTDDFGRATRFADHGEWFELYRTSVGTRPWDGKPDRPITAFHVEVTKVPE
jgi:hypothetical protein